MLSIRSVLTVTTMFICSFSLAYAQNLSNTSGVATNLNNEVVKRQGVVTEQLNQQDVRSKAQEWGLTAEEWNKYEQLQRGERGTWSPGLDPLTTPGIEAKTEQERNYYARLLARKMHERVEKELQFQRAYDKVFAELYPDELPFNVEPHVSQSAGRVLYFTRLDNCEKCDTDIGRILSYASNKTPVDIYIVGSKNNDEAIRQWAAKHHIDPVKVKQRLITLNHDTGHWLQYGDGKMPVAFQVQGDGQWQRLAY
ncbi:integrating conjugative element protein [[Haemophilus] ducreyi]|uniref:TIGR03759 family integrating conjugative element protein n=1 Tax=Haemophilus ducreyi TaxID=730 RepID=UPI0007CDA359|nr:TIGR03759 family integrating conjugative element protein [[Haemophilus] ducreyi]ANF70973.1 integrating conjugative element protein [[Haemophilus] ducreyi]ANF71844.1 integrating conjugative element protein [[Haemophilus] ducreyi]